MDTAVCYVFSLSLCLVQGGNTSRFIHEVADAAAARPGPSSAPWVGGVCHYSRPVGKRWYCPIGRGLGWWWCWDCCGQTVFSVVPGNGLFSGCLHDDLDRGLIDQKGRPLFISGPVWIQIPAQLSLSSSSLLGGRLRKERRFVIVDVSSPSVPTPSPPPRPVSIFGSSF